MVQTNGDDSLHRTVPTGFEQLHSDEVRTDETVVRRLLAEHAPRLASAPLNRVGGSGTDNAMWRIATDVGPDLVARLPRTPGSSQRLAGEIEVLNSLPRERIPVAIPTVRLNGEPSDQFPHAWAVYEWLEGDDAWAAPDTLDGTRLASDLATFVRGIQQLGNLDAGTRADGERGGPMVPLLATIEHWLSDPQWQARELIDVSRIRRIVAETPIPEPATMKIRFVHGDLLPTNMLIRGGRLAAVIDWGGAGLADPAQDLTPGWAVFDWRDRRVFAAELGVDDPTWLRGRAIALQQAVAAVLYYTPRHHPLADVARRTLGRILEGH